MIRPTVAILFAGFVSLACACSSQEDPNDSSPAGAAVSDHALTVRAKLALLGDVRTCGFPTEVSAGRGTVALAGTVDSESARLAAGEVVSALEGVQKVENTIRVAPAATRSSGVVADEQIEDRVVEAMDSDPALGGLGLSVDSDKGVITLDGMVDTSGQLLVAAEAISRIPGVRAVVTRPVRVRADTNR